MCKVFHRAINWIVVLLQRFIPTFQVIRLYYLVGEPQRVNQSAIKILLYVAAEKAEGNI